MNKNLAISKRVSQSTFMVALLLSIAFLIFANTTFGANKNRSDFGGVQVGAITYSYRSMPDQSLNAVLNYIVESGLSSVELMGDVAERYAGLPQTKDPVAIRQWRTSVSMDKYKEIRKVFKSKGVKIHILKLGDKSWSDEEIDYAFLAAKAVGAIGITMEISEDAARRMEPFAEKHKMYVIFHNHGQPGDPKFSFDKVLALGSMLRLNFDAGHYFGATGLNPCELIERLHDKIVSIHIKDKTGPKAADPNKNQEFGKGETPVIAMLQLVQKNKWPINCDIELEYTIPAGSDAVKETAKCTEYCKAALLPKR